MHLYKIVCDIFNDSDLNAFIKQMEMDFYSYSYAQCNIISIVQYIYTLQY